ncbi:conserved Plasmodium protein, unknown function [Plasmodium chabaudi adami]|uniref:Uncharacterized protein n=1 Tax=Plasmodium chabaudi adami TaxID=5826 RepID=A0A1D3RR86_PLACE|nr:conserved Plasmodium protein, unknown function [Plasmodium chabaudi adami]
MNNLMKNMNIPEGSSKIGGGGKVEESRGKDSNKKKNDEHNTSFYYEVYHKLKIYYEYSINEEERKNKCFLKNKNPLNEVTKIQDELVTFFDTNIELFSNPFYFLNYEEDNNINKIDLKNYLGTKYPNLLSLMEDIIKCSLIINRDVYYVCDLFNEVYKKIEKNNIHTEISKTIYINEVLKECIEKENLIIMIFLEILRYINRNEKIGITLDGDKKSMKHEYFSEKEDNYTDSELKKNEEVKSSSDNSSLTNNSLASLNISKKKKKKNINNKKIDGDKFSYYILVNLTENDFVENLFLEIDKIIKFLIKFDGICDKTEYVFNYKTHKINILFNLLDLLFLYFSKFHANINNISAIFKSINHLVSTKYFDFISTDYYVKELDNLLFLESQKKNKKIIKYIRNIKNNKLISQADDYYKLDINISDSALNKLDDFAENGLNPSVSKSLNFEASTGLPKINQPLTSGVTSTQGQNVNTSTGIGNVSNVPNIVVTGSNENLANINQRTQNPLDVNSLNKFGSNMLSNNQINSSTFHSEMNNLGGRTSGNTINSQNKYGMKNNIFNKCLDCTGYWYSCNCSLNNFEKSTLTLSTQISLLLILCLHPNIDRYVYEKRKNIKINNSASPDGTNIGAQSSGKENINDLLELKKKQIDFDNFHTPIMWKYNCMSTEKDYKHLMGMKNNYMISESYITENISYYYSFFSKISDAKKKKKYNKIEEKPVEEFWNDKNIQDASNNGITGSSSTSDSNILMLKFVIGLFINSKEDIFSSIFDDNIFKLLYNFILKKISSYTLIGNLIFHLFHSIFLSSFIKNGRTTDLWNTFIDSHIKRDFNLRRKKKIDSKDVNISKDPLTSSSINKASYIQDDMVIRPNFDGIPRNITQHRMGSDSLLNRTIQNPSDLYMHQNSYRSVHNNIIYIYKKKGECIIDILIFLKILCTNYPRLITKYVCILKNIINRYHSRIMEFSEIDDTFYHHNLEQIHEVDNSGNRGGSNMVPNRGLKNDHDKYSQLKEKKYYNINEERRMIIMKYRSLKLIAEEKMKICIDFYSDIFVQILDFASVLCNNIYDLKIIENVVMCFKTPLTANLNIFNLIKKLFNQFTCALNGKFNEFSKITNKQHIYEKTRGNTKSGLVLNNNFNIIDDETSNDITNNGFIDSINIDATNSGQISVKNSRDLYRNVFGRGANISNTQNVTTGSNNNASLFSPYKDANGKNGNGDEEYEDGNDYRYDDDDDYCSNAYFTYINYFKLNLLEKLFEQNNYLKEILKNNNVMEYLEKNNAYLRNLIKENYLVEKHINDKKIFKNYASNLDAYNKLLSYENDYTASARDANKILQDIEQSNNKLKLFLDFKGVTSLFGVQINPMSDVGGLQNNLDPNALALQGSMSNFLENLLEEKNCINYLLADNKVAENLLRENNILKYEYNKYNMIDLFFKNKIEESQLDNIKSIMLTEYNVNKILSYEKRFKILKTNFDGSYNNKEAIKIFFEDNKEAINFFKDKKYEPPIFKDDDSSSLNENIMNRAKVILKRELEDDSRSYIDARYLLNNIFEKRFYPYNCIKMLEKCLLFLSSVNNNKLCYYMPLNKNLLVDYILLEQYESTSGNTTGGGPIDIANMHLQENNNMNKLFPDEDEKNPFRIRNKKYNNMISLIDTQNYTNTTQFKNVFIHNLNMHSNKISQDKHKIVKHYKTLHLLDMLYEIVKTKGNSSLDLLNLKCLSLEILCSSFVKNSSSALSVLCTITNVFPDIFLDVVKQFKEQNDNLKKKIDLLDKEATIENSKYKKVDQMTNNLSVPNINLKVIIIFMKCVNFLLYMIGIKRKFNMSLTKIWYFFNNIEKIEEIDLKMKSKRSTNPNSNSKTKNSAFFDIFYNFDDFFDEIDNEQNSEDAEHDQDVDSNDRVFNISNLDGSNNIGNDLIGNKSSVERERKRNTKNMKNNLEQGMNNNSTIGGSSNEINANDFEDGENNDIYEKCLKKKLMISDDDKNVCKHLIILTNYIVQNIFYNLINNFILKKIRDQKYEAEDFLDENIKLEIFMNKQENSMFKRRYNYYINKSKNIESQIITMQNDVNTNTSNIYQIEQVLRQNNITFEPYINSQKMFDKAFSSNLGGNLSTSIPTNSMNPFSSNLGIGASTSQLGTTSLGLGNSNTMSLFKQDNKGTNFSSMFNSGNTQTNALSGGSALNTSNFNTSSNLLNPSQANTPGHSVMDSQRTMFASTSRLVSPSQETLGLNSASSNTLRDPSNASLFNTANSSSNNLFKPQTGLNMFSSNNSGPNNSNLFSANQSNTTGLFGGSNVGNTGSNMNDSRGSNIFGSNMQANKTNPASSSFGSMFNQTAGTSNTGGNSLGLGSGFGLGSRPGMNTSNNLMLNNMGSKNTQLGTTLGASTSTSLFGANRSGPTLTNNTAFSSTTNTNNLLNPSQNNSGSSLFNKSPLGTSNTMSNNSNLFSSTTGSTSLFGSNTTPQTSTFGNATNSMTQTTSSSLFNNTFGSQQNNAASNNNLLGLSSTGQGMNQQSSLFSNNNNMGFSNNLMGNSGSNSYLFANGTNQNLMSNNTSLFNTGNIYSHLGNEQNNLQSILNREGIQNITQLKEYYEELKIKTNVLNAEIYKSKMELKKNEYNLQKEKKIQLIKEKKLRYMKSKSDINFKEKEMYILIILVFMYFKLILKGPLPSTKNNKKLNAVMNERFDYLCDFRPTMYLFEQILGESNRFMNTFFNVVFLDNILHEENKNLEKIISKYKNDSNYITIYNKKKTLYKKNIGTEDENDMSEQFSDLKNGENNLFTTLTPEAYYKKKMEYITCSYSKENYNNILFHKIKSLGLSILKILFERDVLFIHMYNQWKNEKILYEKINKFHLNFNTINNNGTNNMTNSNVNDSTSGSLLNNNNFNMLTTNLNDVNSRGDEQIREGIEAGASTGADGKEINFTESLCTPICVHNFLFKNININSSTTYLILLLKNFFRSSEINKIIIYFILQIIIRDTKTTINILKRDADSFNYLKYALKNLFIYNLNQQKFNNSYIISNREIKMQNILNNFIDIPLMYYLKKKNNMKTKYSMANPRKSRELYERSKKNPVSGNEVLNTSNWLSYINKHNGGNNEIDDADMDYQGEKNKFKSDDPNLGLKTKKHGNYLFDETEEGNYLKYMDGDSTNSSYSSYNSETSDSEYKQVDNFEHGGHTGLNDAYGLRNEMVLKYKNFKLKNSKRNKSKYVYDYLSDSDLIDTIKSKKICIFYDNKEKDEENDNLTFYNLSSENINDNYSKNDYYNEIKSVNYNITGFCSSYNFLPINNFYTEKYDFIENELVYMSDLKLYFYIKSFKRHSYFTKLLNIEKVSPTSENDKYKTNITENRDINEDSDYGIKKNNSASPNLRRNNFDYFSATPNKKIIINENDNNIIRGQGSENKDLKFPGNNKTESDDEQNDVEKIVEEEIKVFDFYNKLNKLNENMLFPNIFYDSRGDKMKYIEYIKKVAEREQKENDGKYKNILGPINNILKTQKNEIEKQLSIELRKKYIYINNEYCEWIELSHLLNVDIDYNDIRGGLNKNNSVLNNYSRIPITKLILYFYEIITRKFLFLNNSDSLIESCVLSLLGLSFIPSKQVDKKNIITSIDESLELEEHSFLNSLIKNVIVNFSNYDHISETIKVGYNNNIVDVPGQDKEKKKRLLTNEESNRFDFEDDLLINEDEEESVQGNYTNKIDNENNFFNNENLYKMESGISNDSSKIVLLNKKRKDYYKKNIFLNNSNNLKQYNTFEKNIYFIKSLNIIYMMSKNKKIKEYIINLINTMWYNKYNVFYYITQNVNIDKLKDTEKIIFFKVSLHILNIFIPILDHILNNIDKHVGKFINLSFPNDKEDNNSVEVFESADNNTPNESANKNNNTGPQKYCSIFHIINKDNFNERKNLFEFLNPIFTFDNVQNFINHYINIVKNYNDNYLKHYIYHYYLFNYDFEFQRIYNYSNLEHIHYIKSNKASNEINEKCFDTKGGINEYNKKNVHLLYTNIINVYVNFCKILNSYKVNDTNANFTFSSPKYMENDMNNGESCNIVDDLKNKILKPMHMENENGFNFEDLNEIIGNKSYLLKFLDNYYLSDETSNETQKEHLEKNVYIYNSINYLNINYKNWLLVYKTYIEKITYLVDLILKIKNNTIKKKIYYLKNYFYIVNNIQRHLKNVTSLIKSSHYINFNIQITPILFIVYLFITIFFLSHNNKFAFRYLSCINKGFHNLFKGKNMLDFKNSQNADEDEEEEDNEKNHSNPSGDTIKQNKKIKFYDEINGSKKAGKESDAHLYDNDEFKIDHLKYNKKLKMSSVFSKQILTREFQNNIINIPKTYNQDGSTNLINSFDKKTGMGYNNGDSFMHGNGIEAILNLQKGELYKSGFFINNGYNNHVGSKSAGEDKLYYDIHSEYYKLILKSNEFFGDLLQLLIILITKKHPVLNKYTIIYIYECLYTLLNIYHYSYTYAEKEYNAKNNKNMFISLIKRIDQDILNEFISTLFTDSYKNFFTNSNSTIPIYFYNNIYKFIDYNTEIFMMKNNEDLADGASILEPKNRMTMNNFIDSDDSDIGNYFMNKEQKHMKEKKKKKVHFADSEPTKIGNINKADVNMSGENAGLININFKNNFENKIHLNSRSLNLYEEIYCSNFLYNKNDLNLLSINLLIFLLTRIGIYEIDIKIDENNVKNLIKGNLFIFNKNAENENENKILHTCFLLSALCDTSYINEFVSNEDLFSLFLKSNIFNNLYEYKFNYLSNSISFLTFPTNFLENKNIYIPLPMLIISYITVILKVVDKKGLQLFNLIGKWITKNISIFTNHLIVNNYLMKSHEIAHEINNFTTYNHNLVYKCLCYASTCNFTKEPSSSTTNSPTRPLNFSQTSTTNVRSSKETDPNASKRNTENLINHANVKLVNLDIIYSSTYYLLRLYKNYLLYIHQNYLSLKKLQIVENINKRKKNKSKKIKQNLTYMEDEMINKKGNIGGIDGSKNISSSEFNDENSMSNGVPIQKQNYHGNNYDTNYSEYESDENSDFSDDDDSESQDNEDENIRGTDSIKSNFSKLINSVYNNKNSQFIIGNYNDQNVFNNNNINNILGNTSSSGFIENNYFYIDKGLSFEFNEISLNICNIIKEHTYILQYVKDLLNILSIFVIYDISLRDENELVTTDIDSHKESRGDNYLNTKGDNNIDENNFNYDTRETRRKNIRTHRILQNIIPKYSIKFHCINLCLDIIEYDIGIYDEYVQQYKTKYYEYIKIVLKVFMNTSFYYINIIKYENKHMLKSVSMAMKKLTNIIFFLLTNLTRKEKTTDEDKKKHALLNKFLYDKSGYKKNAHEITTELFNCEDNIFTDKKSSLDNIKKFLENTEIDIHVLKKILTCIIYFTFAMLNNQKVNKINIENINLNHINKINLKKIANTYLENNNILKVFTFILQRSTQIYYLLYNYAMES